MFEFIKTIIQNLLFSVLHIGSLNSFPKPLSSKEEQAYMNKYKDENDLNARNKLIEHNLRLVAHVIKKYYGASDEQDDLISIGTIGLIKGIDSFDHTKGTRLATYAARCVENEVLMHLRANKKNSSVVSMNDPIEFDSEGNPLTISDIVYVDNTIVEDIDKTENEKILYTYINEISDEREKEIIIRRYGLYDVKEQTQKEIAADLGISRSYVSRIEKKVLEDLREKFK